MIDALWTIADYKTGKMPRDNRGWRDQELQLGGYGYLFKKQHPNLALDRLMIVGLANKTPKVVVLDGEKMNEAMEMFQLCLRIYRWQG
jgi:hypothetical protein